MPNMCHGSEEKIMSTGKPVPPAPGVYYWSSVQASRRDKQSNNCTNDFTHSFQKHLACAVFLRAGGTQR